MLLILFFFTKQPLLTLSPSVELSVLMVPAGLLVIPAALLTAKGLIWHRPWFTIIIPSLTDVS